MKIPGLSFSWKRALGITKMKRKISKATGIPTTKAGPQRKLGKLLSMKKNKPSKNLKKRRGLFAASGERPPLLVFTVAHFGLVIQCRSLAIRQRSTWFDKPLSCDFAARKSEKLRWRK